ncbi:MAG: S4 domain-containing protein, partial [Tepidimonas sp.]
MRADQALVQAGLAASRSAAQRLIAAGAVRWRAGDGAPWQPLRKAGEPVPPQAQWQLADDAEVRYVSRGGLKLAAALQRTGVPVCDRR